jgi:hypothetical protein
VVYCWSSGVVQAGTRAPCVGATPGDATGSCASSARPTFGVGAAGRAPGTWPAHPMQHTNPGSGRLADSARARRTSQASGSRPSGSDPSPPGYPTLGFG